MTCGRCSTHASMGSHALRATCSAYVSINSVSVCSCTWCSRTPNMQLQIHRLLFAPRIMRAQPHEYAADHCPPPTAQRTRVLRPRTAPWATPGRRHRTVQHSRHRCCLRASLAQHAKNGSVRRGKAHSAALLAGREVRLQRRHQPRERAERGRHARHVHAQHLCRACRSARRREGLGACRFAGAGCAWLWGARVWDPKRTNHMWLPPACTCGLSEGM